MFSTYDAPKLIKSISKPKLNRPQKINNGCKQEYKKITISK